MPAAPGSGIGIFAGIATQPPSALPAFQDTNATATASGIVGQAGAGPGVGIFGPQGVGHTAAASRASVFGGAAGGSSGLAISGPATGDDPLAALADLPGLGATTAAPASGPEEVDMNSTAIAGGGAGGGAGAGAGAGTGAGTPATATAAGSAPAVGPVADDLTAEEKAQFEANIFALGKIPEVEPPEWARNGGGGSSFPM